VAQLVEATNRKVAGSIPDGVIGILHWHNPSGRTMALGVEPNSKRKEYQEYFLGSKGDRCVGLTTLPPLCAECLWNLGTSTSWNPQGLSRPVMRLLYLLPLKNTKIIITFYYRMFRIYRGADKSLVRPGRKQATATKSFDVHISYLLS